MNNHQGLHLVAAVRHPRKHKAQKIGVGGGPTGDRDREVHGHTDDADPLGTDPEEPIFGSCRFVDRLEINDITQRERHPCNHAGDSTFFGRSFGEDTQDEDWEEDEDTWDDDDDEDWDDDD